MMTIQTILLAARENKERHIFSSDHLNIGIAFTSEVKVLG